MLCEAPKSRRCLRDRPPLPHFRCRLIAAATVFAGQFDPALQPGPQSGPLWSTRSISVVVGLPVMVHSVVWLTLARHGRGKRACVRRRRRRRRCRIDRGTAAMGRGDSMIMVVVDPHLAGECRHRRSRSYRRDDRDLGGHLRNFDHVPSPRWCAVFQVVVEPSQRNIGPWSNRRHWVVPPKWL